MTLFTLVVLTSASDDASLLQHKSVQAVTVKDTLVVTQCADEWPDSCVGWLQQGYCSTNHPSGNTLPWMQDHCPISCPRACTNAINAAAESCRQCKSEAEVCWRDPGLSGCSTGGDAPGSGTIEMVQHKSPPFPPGSVPLAQQTGIHRGAPPGDPSLVQHKSNQVTEDQSNHTESAGCDSAQYSGSHQCPSWAAANYCTTGEYVGFMTTHCRTSCANCQCACTNGLEAGSKACTACLTVDQFCDLEPLTSGCATTAILGNPLQSCVGKCPGQQCSIGTGALDGRAICHD